MSSWRQDFVDALQDRNIEERINYELIDAYTRLADTTAVLEAEKAAFTVSDNPDTTLKDSTAPLVNADHAAQLKSDLAEALRSKGQLQSRLKVADSELEQLRLKSKAEAKLIKDLYTDRGVLIVKVKDRDEELKGKAKLLEAVQDEMLSLNLQLNMAEQRTKKLEGENKDLIDRWMIRMGQEADAMNRASKFS